MKQKFTVQELTTMALLAALLCVSSYISIRLPFSAVPITPYAGDGALSVSGHFYSRIMGKQLDSLVYGHAWNLLKVSGRLISQKVTEK